MAQTKVNFATDSSLEPVSKNRNSIGEVRKVISELENAAHVSKNRMQGISSEFCYLQEIEGTVETDQTDKESVGEIIINELEGLKDGWSGPESVAPTKKILMEAKELVKALQIQSRNNLRVWVDDDGTVTFYWKLKNRDILSIDLYGDGKAHCTFTPSSNNPSILGNFRFSDNKPLKEFVNSRIN